MLYRQHWSIFNHFNRFLRVKDNHSFSWRAEEPHEKLRERFLWLDQFALDQSRLEQSICQVKLLFSIIQPVGVLDGSRYFIVNFLACNELIKAEQTCMKREVIEKVVLAWLKLSRTDYFIGLRLLSLRSHFSLE